MAIRLDQGGTNANLEAAAAGYVVKLADDSLGLTTIPDPSLGKKIYLAAFKQALAGGDTFFSFAVPVACVFSDPFVGSYGSSAVAATAETVFSILSGGIEVATAVFAPGGTVCTFEVVGTVADIELLQWVDLTIMDPAVDDATLACVRFTIVGDVA